MANKIDHPLFPVAGNSPRSLEAGRAAKSDAERPVTEADAAAPVQLPLESTVVQMSTAPAAEAPVLDLAKIQAVRHALESGTYRIDPEEIAARLSALERELFK